MFKQSLVIAFLLLLLPCALVAQADDSLKQVPADSVDTRAEAPKKDTTVITVKDTDTSRWSPGKRAAVYSAIFPGAGQVYNKKYWKLPLVYGALAFPTYTFVDNLNWFNKTRFAFNTLTKIVNSQYRDSTGYDQIDPKLIPIVDRGDLNGLKNYRNDFRRNVDYSVLGFLALWGLNVIDAAVDGHLRDFNISDDLSLQIKPGYMPIANTTGVGVVLNIGKNHVNRVNSGR
ncbi:MAG: hypothetical protein KF862_06535 [Chitinophagaceae bacterium]|nr:hypothetical protein [Chitinophagaceae bacterium]